MDDEELEQIGRQRDKAAARAEAAELELERAHRLLDQCGVPREVPSRDREAGAGRPLELSLLGRLELLLEEQE